MWFAWDGSRVRMTHTRTRQKFVNLEHEPRVALSIADLDDHYRFLEIRGAFQGSVALARSAVSTASQT